MTDAPRAAREDARFAPPDDFQLAQDREYLTHDRVEWDAVYLRAAGLRLLAHLDALAAARLALHTELEATQLRERLERDARLALAQEHELTVEEARECGHAVTVLKRERDAAEAARLALQQEHEQLKKRLEWDSTSAQLERCRKQHEDNLKSLGYAPNDLQAAYRGLRDGKWGQPPLYDPKLTIHAVIDALIVQGSIAAWSGDGTGCVEQMIEAQAKRAEAAEAACTTLRQQHEELREYADAWKRSAEGTGQLVVKREKELTTLRQQIAALPRIEGWKLAQAFQSRPLGTQISAGDGLWVKWADLADLLAREEPT